MVVLSDSRMTWKSQSKRVKPVDEMWKTPRRILSTEHEKFRRNPGGPSPKAKYSSDR